MAIALVANTFKQSVLGATVTTDAIDTTGANLLIVLVDDFQTDASVLTDSKGNTWTPLTAQAEAAAVLGLAPLIPPPFNLLIPAAWGLIEALGLIFAKPAKA